MKNYCVSPSVSTIFSWFKMSIINDISVGAPIHVKYVVDGINTIVKRMLKFSMAKLIYPVLINDYPNVYKFIQVYETEEYQDVILAE